MARHLVSDPFSRVALAVMASLVSVGAQPLMAQTLPQRYAIAQEFVAPAFTPGGAAVAGINQVGQAVGNGMLNLGTTTKLVWIGGKLTLVTVPIERTGAMLWTGSQATRLKPLLTNATATVRDVNDSGWAVGDAAKSTATNASSYAVLWRSGTVKDLGAGARSVAQHINAQGWVAGYRFASTSASAPMVPFIWRGSSVLTLSPPSGVSGVGCVGLSDAGVMPCRSHQLTVNPDGSSAYTRTSYLWSNGSYQALTHAGASQVYVGASSANGTVAGTLMLNGDTRERIFIWRNGQFTPLAPMPEGFSGNVLSVSDAGVVRVQVWNEQLGSTASLLFTPDGQTVDPRTLGVSSGEQVLDVADINGQGQLAAAVRAPGSATIRQVLLSPLAP